MILGYASNRQNFLSAAQRSGAKVTTYELSEELSGTDQLRALDVAVLGKDDAPVTFVVTSGIHGVELPFGSALQYEWLSTARAVCRSGRVRMVFAHALNPFGAAMGRRNDHQNIDPNRNFIDFTKPLPSSNNYRPLADAFTPKDLDNRTLFRAYAKMLTFAFVTHGLSAFKQALVGGQSDFPQGLYYCGREPSWTRQRWDEIVRDHVRPQDTERLWHVDIHTGDGPYGVMRLLLSEEQAFQRVQGINGLGVTPVMTQEALGTLSGDIVDAWGSMHHVGTDKVTAMAIEVGTSKLHGINVMHWLIMRNLLRERYEDNHPRAAEIIAKTREIFCPTDPVWQDAALRQGRGAWTALLNAAALKP